MLESPCLEEICRFLLQEVKSGVSHPLIHEIGLGLKMLCHAFNAMF